MCSKFLGGQTQSLGGPQARRFSVQEGPKSREHESLGCLWERMSRSHVWEMPPPSRPSWVLRCLSACWKYREILQGRHETKKFSFFFLIQHFPQIIWLWDSLPTIEKKRKLATPCHFLLVAYPLTWVEQWFPGPAWQSIVPGLLPAEGAERGFHGWCSALSQDGQSMSEPPRLPASHFPWVALAG